MSFGSDEVSGVSSRVLNAKARYRRILRFAAWHLAVTWWYELALPRLGLSRVAERTRAKRMQRFAQRFHALAVELGGLMIKVGQFMSSRLDVLPPEVTAELEGLQDEVPPVPFTEIRRLAEHELGAPLYEIFEWIDETPLAAASLGQTHRARLPAEAALNVALADVRHGAPPKHDTHIRNVVLKVQRPGIDEIVEIDLAALRKVGGWLSRVKLVSQRVDAPALIKEFAETCREEIDYLNEAANAERFAECFVDNSQVAVPTIVWERSSRRVLTLEDVTAIKITDTAALRAAGIAPADVAQTFAAVMFDQLFTHGFFHADPHPGNIFVTPQPGTDPASDWKLTFIDFGMMGEVPASMRAGLRGLLVAVASRDGAGLVAAMQKLGVLLPSADTNELERAMTQLFARFGGMGFAELREVDPKEFLQFAEQFGDIVRTMPFQLPENFMLIIRAMSLVSGVCSALEAEFNLWDAIEPYAEAMIREESGNIVQDFAQQALSIAGIALQMPKRIDALLTRAEEGRLAVSSPVLEQRVTQLGRTAKGLVSGVIFSALLISGAIVRANDEVFGTVLIGVSVLPLLHALWVVNRRF